MFFWENSKHHICNIINAKIGPVIRLLGLWHSWDMFSVPYHNNQNIYINLVYNNITFYEIVLFDADYDLVFLNSKFNSYGSKLLDNFYNNNDTAIREMFGRLVASYFSDETYSVSRVDFFLEKKDISIDANMRNVYPKILIYSYEA